MEKKINLTNEEIDIIERHLKGRIEIFFTAESDKKLWDKIIDDADKLMVELDAYDESGEDLILWYYNKYKNQK